jgi:hypothetical protein
LFRQALNIEIENTKLWKITTTSKASLLAWSRDPEGNTDVSVATGRASHAGRVKRGAATPPFKNSSHSTHEKIKPHLEMQYQWKKNKKKIKDDLWVD